MLPQLSKCLRRVMSAVLITVMPAVLIALVCASCGHPASLGECEQIVEQVTVLQVRQEQLITDKASLAREAEHQKKTQHDAMMQKCVGKRITDSIMRCVRNAKTADEIVNQCFD